MPPWSMPTSTSADPGRIDAQVRARHELGRQRAGLEHAADDEVGVGDRGVEALGRRRERERRRSAGPPRPATAASTRTRCAAAREHQHAAAEARGDARRLAADVAGADRPRRWRRARRPRRAAARRRRRASVARQSAPAIGARRPAMRDIGASSGMPPCGIAHRLAADHAHAGASTAASSAAIAIELREAEAPSCRRAAADSSGGWISLTFTTRSHVHTAAPASHERRARRPRYAASAKPTAAPAPRSTTHRVAVGDERRDAGRRHADAPLAVLGLARNADPHRRVD